MVAREVAARALAVLPDPEWWVFLGPIAAAHKSSLYSRFGKLADDVFGHRGLIGAAEAVVADAYRWQYRVGDGEYPTVEEADAQLHPGVRNELARI